MSYRSNKLFALSLAMVKDGSIRSCDLDLSPMTLKFKRVRAVVKIRCSCKMTLSCVQRCMSYCVHREKKLGRTQRSPSLPRSQ